MRSVIPERATAIEMRRKKAYMVRSKVRSDAAPVCPVHAQSRDFARFGDGSLPRAPRFWLRIPDRPREENTLQVFVRDNNVDQALRALKKKLQREGVFREMKRRRSYEKPSEKRAREQGEAIRRARKAARKLAQREGIIAKPRSKR